jgi:hypothetical protein
VKKSYLILTLIVLLSSGVINKITFASRKSTDLVKSPNTCNDKNPLKQQPSTYCKLTAQQRKNYILSIDQQKITKPSDTSTNSRKYSIIYVPLRLSNHSKETLRYFTMTCSWYDDYQTNNSKVRIFTGDGCDSNSPIVSTICLTRQHCTISLSF